jgi:hypothetical protein
MFIYKFLKQQRVKMLLVLLETPETEGQEIGCGKALSALINTVLANALWRCGVFKAVSPPL